MRSATGTIVLYVVKWIDDDSNAKYMIHRIERGAKATVCGALAGVHSDEHEVGLVGEARHEAHACVLLPLAHRLQQVVQHRPYGHSTCALIC